MPHFRVLARTHINTLPHLEKRQNGPFLRLFYNYMLYSRQDERAGLQKSHFLPGGAGHILTRRQSNQKRFIFWPIFDAFFPSYLWLTRKNSPESRESCKSRKSRKSCESCKKFQTPKSREGLKVVSL